MDDDTLVAASSAAALPSLFFVDASGVCLKLALQKILFNDKDNVPQRDISATIDPVPRQQYLATLEEYAAKVCAQEDL